VRRVGAEVDAVAEAGRGADRALAQAVDAREADLARTLNLLGGVEKADGRLDVALTMFERTLAIWERTRGTSHSDVALVLHNLAILHRGRKDLSRARALEERALDIWASAFGEGHPESAYPLMGMGHIAIAQRGWGEAARRFGRAAEVLEASAAPSEELADARFGGALALWELGDHAAARRLAHASLDDLRSLGPEWDSERRNVTSWLKGRARP
jgi:tetratricopeptide (TPR) repeat protein